ncbi:MAG: carboxymuconolactone decarboxylase family protein [Ignavibacteriales bacterium]
MGYDVRGMFNEFVGGLGLYGKAQGEMTGAFMGLLGAAYKEGALSVKVKELISVGIAAYNRCQYCIVYHVYHALKAGATREEIMEAANVAVAFGGGPSMSFLVTLVRESIDVFAPEFGK